MGVIGYKWALMKDMISLESKPPTMLHLRATKPVLFKEEEVDIEQQLCHTKMFTEIKHTTPAMMQINTDLDNYCKGMTRTSMWLRSKLRCGSSTSSS